ncbi:hypothetical protein [Nocardia beijingensis]
MKPTLMTLGLWAAIQVSIDAVTVAAGEATPEWCGVCSPLRR